MPEPTQATIELNKDFTNRVGELQKAAAPSNWVQKQRTLYEPTAEEEKLNQAIRYSLQKDLNLPRSMVLTPKQVDEIAKKLKLSDTAKSYLQDVAKEGPIDEGLLDVLHIEKPQINGFPLDKLPDAKDFSVADAKDLLKFISADDPYTVLDELSKRSRVGYLLRDSRGASAFRGLPEFLHKDLVEPLRKKYGFDEDASIPQRTKSFQILNKIYNHPSSDDAWLGQTHSNILKTPGALKALSEMTPGHLSKEFRDVMWPGQDKSSNDFGYINGADHPLIQKENEARKRLISQGINPSFEEFHKPYAGKYTPREIADIIKRGPTETPEGDSEFVAALKQARDLHEQRTGEAFTSIPKIVDTIRENPYVFPGSTVPPTAKETEKSWEDSLKAADTLEANRAKEAVRLDNLIASLKGDPKLKDVVGKEADVIGRTADNLESLRDKFFSGRVKDSPVYQDALERNMGMYKLAEKQYDERFATETIPDLRGRFMKIAGINFANRPAYQAALARADKARNEYLGDMRFKYENQAHNQALSEMNHLYTPQKDSYLAQSDASKQSAAMQNELWKSQRDRQIFEEELARKAAHSDTANKAAQGELHKIVGADKTAEEQRKITARINEFNAKGPGAELAQQVILNNATNQVPGGVPYQPVVMPPSTHIPPSGAGALGTAIAAMGPNLFQQPQQQQPVNLVVNGQQRPSFAEGGVVPAPQYNELMAQQLAAIQQFMQEKARHQNLPTMAVNPQAQTLGNMAIKMGEAMGPGSMMGAWAQGMGTAPANHNDYLEKQYKQSLNKAQLEQVLADLRKDATVTQREREHNLSTEELKRNELAEQARHHLASEDLSGGQLEELKRYHDLMGNEKKRKPEGLSEKDLAAITKDSKSASQAIELAGDAATLAGLSTLVHTGRVQAEFGPWAQGAFFPKNTVKGVDFFKNKTDAFVNKSSAELTGVKSAYAIRLMKEAKTSTDLVPETNVENSSKTSISKGEVTAENFKSMLRRGQPLSELMKDFHYYNIARKENSHKTIDKQGELQGSTPEQIENAKLVSDEVWQKSADRISSVLESAYKKLGPDEQREIDVMYEELRGDGE